MLELALHVGVDAAQREHSEVVPDALLLTHSKIAASFGVGRAVI